MNMRAFQRSCLLLGWLVAITVHASAQTQPLAQPNYGQPQAGYQQPQAGYQQPQAGYQQPQAGYQQPQAGYIQPQSGYQQPYASSSVSRKQRSDAEMGGLYATSVAYGLGMGIWASTEMGLGEDPGVFLIAPIALGVAAPIGAYVLDRPSMKRGQPMAITAGLLLGAGEGLGIWGTQRVVVNANNAWGFRGLSRAAALGSTLGGVAGYLAGEFMEPPPTTSFLAVSGAFWGTAVGSMFAYGSTNDSWGKSNDRTATGGLVGYNIGMIAAGGLGALFVPTETQLAWMWSGAGIGAAVSLPVFLLYAGEGGPPARRGFIFMGTATTLGIIAGAVFGSGAVKTGQKPRDSYLANRGLGHSIHLMGVVPTLTPDHLGLSLFGSLE
jgi:hypothetical protein